MTRDEFLKRYKIASSFLDYYVLRDCTRHEVRSIFGLALAEISTPDEAANALSEAIETLELLDTKANGDRNATDD